MNLPRATAGLTLLEALIILVIIILLSLCTLPNISAPSLERVSYTQSLNHVRLLTLATQQMVLDGQTSGNPDLGWPGDTGGSFSNWVRQLVDHNYLTTNDLCKLLSAPGKIVKPEQMFTMADTGVILYAVSSNSPPETVFLSSANFTNTPQGGLPLDRAAKPYGDKGFVIFRKGGDGSTYTRPRDVTNASLIGKFAPICR